MRHEQCGAVQKEVLCSQVVGIASVCEALQTFQRLIMTLRRVRGLKRSPADTLRGAVTYVPLAQASRSLRGQACSIIRRDRARKSAPSAFRTCPSQLLWPRLLQRRFQHSSSSYNTQHALCTCLCLVHASAHILSHNVSLALRAFVPQMVQFVCMTSQAFYLMATG